MWKEFEKAIATAPQTVSKLKLTMAFAMFSAITKSAILMDSIATATRKNFVNGE